MHNDERSGAASCFGRAILVYVERCLLGWIFCLLNVARCFRLSFGFSTWLYNAFLVPSLPIPVGTNEVRRDVYCRFVYIVGRDRAIISNTVAYSGFTLFMAD